MPYKDPAEREANRKAYRAKNAEKLREQRRAYRRRTRLRVIELLGRACACCGESEEAFLCSDHINDDGADHRRGLRNGKTYNGPHLMNLAILRDPNPHERFQLLCANCNLAKTRPEGCPHQKGKTLTGRAKPAPYTQEELF